MAVEASGPFQKRSEHEKLEIAEFTMRIRELVNHHDRYSEEVQQVEFLEFNQDEPKWKRDICRMMRMAFNAAHHSVPAREMVCIAMNNADMIFLGE